MNPGGGDTMGMNGMIGMIIPPDVIGPGAVVGSQIGPVVCMMRPVSGFAGESEVTEATKAPEEVVGIFEEVVATPDKGFRTAAENEEEEAELLCEKDVTEATKAREEVVGISKEVVDTRTAAEEKEPELIDQVLGEVVRVSLPINHSVVVVMIEELERAGAVELSQAHSVP